MVLEAPVFECRDVTVELSELFGPNGSKISSKKASKDAVFNYVDRPIELFFVRYLQIKGISLNGFEQYDERHIPERFRRPYNSQGIGKGTWLDRPDAGKFYPDIAVPLELASPFTVLVGQNQSIWIDIYVPKIAPSGVFRGQVNVRTKVGEVRSISVDLRVLDFALPDETRAKSMLVVNPTDINKRYFGKEDIKPVGEELSQSSVLVRQRHFQMAHRHRITLVDPNYEYTADQPSPYEWSPRLDGSLYSAKEGYEGPGTEVPHDLFVIGLYGGWGWRDEVREEMWRHTNAWEKWFVAHAPKVERFLYLIDESKEYATIEKWASWIRTNPGIGKNLPSFATMDATKAVKFTPSLSIAASTISVADSGSWSAAAKVFRTDPNKRLMMYNGHRPASGSFVTEDDGVALRELAWGQWKAGIHRWFYWESTYYNSYQGRTKEEKIDTRLFVTAQTFGGVPKQHESLGESGWNYSNGDGVLFYPGTDTNYPQDSYGVNGPFASLRLKHWRRGIQDVEYLALAAQKDRTKTDEIVQQIVPKVLWEYGVADSRDPTWQRTDISWPTNPDLWERARAELASIITGTPTKVNSP